jgi:membrane protease YdiL (CAAX protease family)
MFNNDPAPTQAIIFFGLLLLGLISASAALTRPRPLEIARKRFARLVWSRVIALLWTATAVVLCLALFHGRVPAFLHAAGAIPPVAWARACLQVGSTSAVLVVAILAAIAVAAIGGQYVLFQVFSTRRLTSSLDEIRMITGRGERVVQTLGAVFTAGIGEELLLRMLVPAAIYSFDSNLVAAVLVPYVVFVALHAYQRAIGLTNATLAGAALTIIYLVTQQLAAAIILHMIANLLAAGISPEIRAWRERRLVRRALASRPAPEAARQ